MSRSVAARRSSSSISSRAVLLSVVAATAGLLNGQSRAASTLELYGTFDGTGTIIADFVGISPSANNLEWSVGTYSHSGGVTPNGYTLAGGGIDPTLSVFAGTTLLATNDNLSATNHDAEIHTSNLTGRTGSAVLPAMDWAAAATVKLAPVSGNALGNGSFSYVSYLPNNGFQYLQQLSVPTTAHLSFLRASASYIETEAGSPIAINGNVQLSAGSNIVVKDADFSANQYELANSSIDISGSGVLHATSSLQIGDANGDRSHVRITGTGGIDAQQIYLAAAYTDSAVTVEQTSGTVHAMGLTLDRTGSGAASTSSYALYGGTLSLRDLWINDATMTIAGGTLELEDLWSIQSGQIGGSITWTGGTIAVTSAYDTPADTHLMLGSSLTLAAGRTLSLNAPGLNTFVNLAGGKLALSGLADGGTNLNWQSGELSLTGSAVTSIATGKVLGDQLTLRQGMTLRTAGAVNIASGSRLMLEDGGRAILGGVTNNGEIRLTGSGEASLDLTGATALTNNGTIGGSGRIAGTITNQNAGQIAVAESDALRVEGNVSNNGQVRLTGGQLTVTGSLVNNASGKITGRGVLSVGSLDNRGTLTLSAGLSDVDVSLLSNRNAAKTIVTGAGNAAFYGSVVNDAGSEFRISADSRATFLGPVTNLAAFTGTGVKVFESTANGGALGAVDGSSIVDASASLSAAGVRERQLTVYGQASLVDNSPVSRLQSLAVSDGGTFDLRNNALVLDYDAATPSPLASIRAAIGAGAIFSSSLSPNRTLLAIDAATFGGTKVGDVSFDASSIILAVVLRGDADVSGSVNFSDLLSLARNYGGTAKTWSQGDFTGDGAVRFEDLLALARNYGQSLAGVDAAVLAPDSAQFKADFALAVALAPEPGTITAVAALGLGVAGVRRRRV